MLQGGVVTVSFHVAVIFGGRGGGGGGRRWWWWWLMSNGDGIDGI